LSRLLNYFPPAKTMLIAFLLLGSSLALDFWCLTDVYTHVDDRPGLFEKTGRSYERYQAGKILESLNEQYGPGYIYTDLVPAVGDESLAFMTYPYNCAWNPEMVSGNPRWAALFTNSHYRPFLSKKFPQAQWFVIPTADPHDDGLHILGIVPVTPQTAPVFRSWQETYLFCMNTNLKILDYSKEEDIAVNLNEMVKFYPRIPKDPFLQSFYLGKVVYEYSKEKNLHPNDSRFNYSSYAGLMDQALQSGCPDPLVYTYLGRLLIQEKQFIKAKIVLKKAIRWDPNNEKAMELLNDLEKNESAVHGI